MNPLTSAAILGAGSLGTALAKLLSPKLESIVLVSIEPECVEGINRDHRNPKYLVSVELAPTVRATMDHREALAMPLIIFAVPSAAIRSEAEKIAALGLPSNTPLLSCAKGIERDTGERLSQILRDVFPTNPIGILTGPNHAEEIAANLVTCAVVASENPQLAEALQELFTLPHFRTYTSDDVAGIELGGAVKNVYAIAAGMAHGLGYGDNSTAALITRALAELTRLGVALGGRPLTFAGLAGMGDLVATCISAQSRNRQVGVALGEGHRLEEIVAERRMVAEGVKTTAAVLALAARHDIDMPIAAMVGRVLYEGCRPADMAAGLMGREAKAELHGIA